MKITTIILTLTFLTCFSAGWAQPFHTWSTHNSGGISQTVASSIVDANGNTYNFGTFSGTVDFDPGSGTSNLTSLALSDLFIQKLSLSGELLWVHRVGSTGNETASKIDLDPVTNDILMIGSLPGVIAVDFDPSAAVNTLSSSSKVFLWRLTSSGTFVSVKGWTSTGAVSLTALEIANNGDIYIGGNYASFGTTVMDLDPNAGIVTFGATLGQGTDGFLLKLNSAGNFVWAKQHRSNNNISSSSINGICLNTAQNVVFVGGRYEGTVVFSPTEQPSYLAISSGQGDMFMQTFTSSTGAAATIQSRGGTEDDAITTLKANGSTVYVGGYFRGTVNFDPGFTNTSVSALGQADIFLLRVNNFQPSPGPSFGWVRRTGGTANDFMVDLSLDAAGNIYCGSHFNGSMDADPGTGTFTLTSQGQQDIAIQKINQSGNFVWGLSVGGTTNDGLGSINSNNNNVWYSGYFSGTVDLNPLVGIQNFSTSGGTDLDGFTTRLNQCGEIPVISSNSPVCQGSSINLFAPTIPGATYMWTGPNSFSSNLEDPVRTNASTLHSGDYSLTIAIGTCWYPSATINVNVQSVNATVTASGPTTFCSGGSVTLTSSSATGNTWSTGQTTQSIVVTSSGTYTVTVNDGTCSATSSATTVTVNPLPTTPTITAFGPTTFCAGGSVTLTASGGSSYLWSNGATTASINVTTTGTYTVQVTNASGCQSAPSAGTSVTVNPVPTTPTITASGPTTFCAGGSVTLSAPASTSYLWSNGATTQSINVTTSGTYTVQVKNAAGCQSAASSGTTVTVNPVPTTPTITASGPTTFCAGGSVTLSAPSSTSYLWSNGATTQSINVTTAGTYTVQVTNASGCQSAPSAGTSVTVNPVPTTPTITASGPTTFCAGGSVTLSAPTSTSYLWSNGATTQSINVTTSGTFTVQVTNASGCQSASSTGTTVTVNPIPAVPTISASGSTTICAGNTVTLSAPNSTGYLWSNGATTQSIIVTSTGSFSVTVSNASGCTRTSVATIVTVNPTPATPTITASGPTTFCAGGSVTLTSSAGSSYLWSNGATTQSINVTTSGTYTVQVTNASGCQSAASAGTTVTINPLPATPTITASGPTTFCENGSVTLSAPASTSYLWSNGATTQSINVTSSGTFTVQVTNAAGCQSPTSMAQSVTVNTATDITVHPVSPGLICAGSPFTLSATAVGTNLSYQWLLAGTPIAGATSATYTVSSATTSQAGSYLLQVNGTCGSTLTNGVLVDIFNAPSIVSQPQSQTTCQGQSVTLNVNATGNNLSYQWRFNGSPLSGSTNASLTMPSIALSQAGNYDVVITNSCGSVTSSVATISVNTAPTIISQPQSATVCQGSSVLFGVNFSGAPSAFQWRRNGVAIPGATSTTLTIPAAQVSDEGNYTLDYTTTCGVLTSQAAVLDVQVSPTITQHPQSVSICAGQALNVAVQTQGDVSSYQWMLNGSPIVGATAANYTVPSATPAQAGTYSVNVINNVCGISALSQDAVIQIATAPIFAQQPVGGTFCQGDTVSFVSQFSNAVDIYEWWYLGSPLAGGSGPVLTLNNVQTSQSGTYVLNAYNQCGNTFSSLANIQVNPSYQQTITQTICFGDSYVFNGTNLSQAGTYVEHLQNISGCDSITTLVLSVLPENQTQLSASICLGDSYQFDGQSLTASGTYSALYTAANGCDSLVELSLVVVDPNQVYPTAVSLCPGNSLIWGSQTLTQAGVYQQVFTAVGGCDSLVELTLTLVTVPVISIANNSGNLSVTSGLSNYQWYLNGVAISGATSASHTAIQDGNYHVVFETVEGCAGSSDTLQVDINQASVVELEASLIQAFPNPTKDLITILLPKEANSSQQIDLLDATGRRIQTFVDETSQQIRVISLASYTSAYYWIKVDGYPLIPVFKQ